ncbi:hypothetical protein BJV78DRAFT_909040 [Lactifluus subvellereus]|nr:hypothetical protein BJV78DRAFT_909040 [Lactifluus subvellereus]
MSVLKNWDLSFLLLLHIHRDHPLPACVTICAYADINSRVLLSFSTICAAIMFPRPLHEDPFAIPYSDSYRENALTYIVSFIPSPFSPTSLTQ